MAAIINKVELRGAQTIDYLWMTNTEMTAEWETILNQASYEPTWDINTQFLAKFNNTLNAGNAPEIASSTLTGWKVYRQDLEGSALKYVKTLSPEEYESLLVDTWMKDQDEIDMFEEHIKSGYYGEESMNESVDQKSLKKELFVHLNGPRAALSQTIKELKADNEHYLKVESNIRFNYENLIEDLTNTLHSIVEFQNSLLVSELESKGDTNEENS